MSRKKYSKELKLKLIKEHLNEGISYWKLSKDYGIEASIIRRWGDTFVKKHVCRMSITSFDNVTFEN